MSQEDERRIPTPEEAASLGAAVAAFWAQLLLAQVPPDEAERMTREFIFSTMASRGKRPSSDDGPFPGEEWKQ